MPSLALFLKALFQAQHIVMGTDLKQLGSVYLEPKKARLALLPPPSCRGSQGVWVQHVWSHRDAHEDFSWLFCCHQEDAWAGPGQVRAAHSEASQCGFCIWQSRFSSRPWATQLMAGRVSEHRNSGFPFPHFCYKTRIKNDTFQS